jgi:hypothetical protein
MNIQNTNIRHDTVWDYNNPEMADMDNPTGDQYRPIIQVEATTAAGRRFIHWHLFEPDQVLAAQYLAGRILGRGTINTEYWTETYEVYGSEAWQAADNLRAHANAMGPLAGTVRDF